MGSTFGLEVSCLSISYGSRAPAWCQAWMCRPWQEDRHFPVIIRSCLGCGPVSMGCGGGWHTRSGGPRPAASTVKLARIFVRCAERAHEAGAGQGLSRVFPMYSRRHSRSGITPRQGSCTVQTSAENGPPRGCREGHQPRCTPDGMRPGTRDGTARGVESALVMYSLRHPFHP